MKLSKNFLVFVLLISVSLLLFDGCGKPKKKFDTKPVSIKQFDTPPGADPSVTAELGGKGFKGEGWQTNEKYNSSGSPKAVKGGSLIMSMKEFPPTLRTIGKDWNNNFNDMTGALMYETLLNIDPVTDDYVPGLATHWQISEDKLTFKFRLNPDARWADGKPVTSEDIIASYKILTDPGILDAYSNELFNTFETPAAESKYIVSVKSKELNWRQFYYFVVSMKILPAHYIGKITGTEFLEKYQFEYIPGSGAYIIDKNEIKKDQSIMIRRRSDYWAENEKFNSGRNNFDLVRFEVNKDDNLELEKLKKGEVDVIGVTRASIWQDKFDFDEAKRGVIARKKVFNKLPAGISGIALNTRKEPFDDIRVRKAFSYLYNREKFNEKLFYNSYFPINSYFPGTVYENPANPKIKYNLDSAAALLAQAGWKEKNSDGYLVKDGKIFEIELPFIKGQDRYFTIYQEDLKKAGISLVLKEMDQPTIFTLGNERNFKMLPIAWTGLTIPNPEGFLKSNTADELNTVNWEGIKDKRIDELCDEYNITFDKNKRIKQIREIDFIARNYFGYVFGWYAPYQRIAFQNKFGYPDGVLERRNDYLIIPSIWYNDPEKAVDYEEAVIDKSKTLQTGDLEDKYWMTVKDKEEKSMK